MFIKKKELEELIKRLKTLETYAKNDYERFERIEYSVKKLKETIGEEDSTGWYYSMINLFSATGYKEDKPLSIKEQIRQIIKQTGLEIKHTEEKTEIVKKPVKKEVKKVLKKK
jgi:hypothetical protein